MGGAVRSAALVARKHTTFRCVFGQGPLGPYMLIPSMQSSLTHDTELLAEALDRLEREFAALPGYRGRGSRRKPDGCGAGAKRRSGWATTSPISIRCMPGRC